MIPFPTGVRVWVAAGHTDMRRGMRGLALQVQEALKRDPHVGDFLRVPGPQQLFDKFSGMTALACRFMPSDWSAAGSFGHLPRPASFRSRRLNSLTCWTGSIGEIPSTHGGRRRPDER